MVGAQLEINDLDVCLYKNTNTWCLFKTCFGLVGEGDC